MGSGLLLAVCLVGVAAASPSSVPKRVSSVVSSVLPGAASRLSGGTLWIAVPAGLARLPGAGSAKLSAPAPPGGEGADIIAGELGWKAAVAAGLAGARNRDIVFYQLTEPGHRFTPIEKNYLNGQLRSTAGEREYQPFRDIGTVPLSTLTKQLRSNVRVLKRALPQGTVIGSQQKVIRVDAGAQDYAFEVDLKVAHLASLRHYEGDLVDGLGTGLVGGPTAPSEGLAINVVDSRGLRASWWSAERAQSGTGVSDRVLPSSGGSENVSFPDLTGGPAPTGFGSG